MAKPKEDEPIPNPADPDFNDLPSITFDGSDESSGEINQPNTIYTPIIKKPNTKENANDKNNEG